MASNWPFQSHNHTPYEILQPWSTPINLATWFESDIDLIAIIDGAPPDSSPNSIPAPPYLNKALKCSPSLSRLIEQAATLSNGAGLTSDQRDFQRWLISQCPSTASRPRQTVFLEDHLWSTSVLDHRWVVIRGVPLPGARSLISEQSDELGSKQRYPDVVDSRRESSSMAGDTGRGSVLTSSEPSELAVVRQSGYKVRCFMSEPLSAHQTFVRRFRWASTPAGPMSSWDSQLIETVSLTLTNTDPVAVFWGTEMTSIYNEAFISIAGQKHPAMMGDAPRRAFAEVWDLFFEDRIQLSRRTKEPFCEKALCLLLERRGFPEETFMTFTFLPLLGHSGEVVGFYHTVTEETQQVLSRRRMSLLLSASEVLSKAQSLQAFWGLLIESLTEGQYDTPFAVLYSVDNSPGLDDMVMNDDHITNSGSSSSTVCRLEGFLGYPADHESLLKSFRLSEDDAVLAPMFRSAMGMRGPTFVSLQDGTLPLSLVQRLQKRGFGDDCNTLAICPLRPTNHDAALGFLTIGLSSRRPCDDDYRSFVNLLVKNIASSMASVVLLEDEKRRALNNAERAAYERAQLTAKLQERELEKQIQEHKFMLMARQVPVGIFDLNPLGEINFCNQAWYDITGHDRNDNSRMSWTKKIHDDDAHLVQKEWTTVSIHRQPVSFEARLKKRWQAEPGDDCTARLDSTWFLSRMYPVLADDGSVVNVIGSFTDISFQKYSMTQQIQRVEEAIEAKRQQENFVDMTSHEMRNPLNAMLLCAQELSGNLQAMQSGDIGMPEATKEALANSIESAETIIYCGRHQKRIIDDVLTLSKLDARLLQINPIEVQPISMVQETLRLFESEVRAQGIDVKLEISESMKQCQINHVLLDPSRVVQILVNFIANAIKFTKTEEVRQMLVTIGGSLSQPTEAELASAKIQLIPHGGLYQDPTIGGAWGYGKSIYLQFIVRDTGPGISSEDMLKLFGRFTQAQPKTHAHYGGSGLGLFISQQLAELQGGRVGIASEPGVGSSFYFYIKARCAAVADTTLTPAKGKATSKLSNSSKRTGGREKQEPNIHATSVLIVEDNLVNQKVLKRQLQKLGYNISVANHGEEALEIISQSKLYKHDSKATTNGQEFGNKLDIIFMDIEMPVMDGRECIKKIRELENEGRLRLHIPVVALTANARADQIKSAKGYGFDEVVSKPFQLSEVVHQISKFVDHDSNEVANT